MDSLSEMLMKFFNDFVGLTSALSSVIVAIIMVVVWLLVGVIINRILKMIIKRALRVSKDDPRAITVSKLIMNICKYVVWFIIILLILGQFGIDITPFIASAGVIGLAVGFGAQQLVKDFISGFFIIFEHTFDINDVVEIDGFKGNVVSLGLRTTTLQNWKGEVKTVSNGNIATVINFSRNDSVGIVKFGVSYDTNLEKFKHLMDEFMTLLEGKYDDFTESPQFLGVTELADSSINMQIIFRTVPMGYFVLEREIRKDLVTFCAENNVEIPFPQLVVHNAQD